MFQAVGIKTGFFQQRFDKSMFKTLWYKIPDDKDLFMILVIMGIISSKQSERTEVGMGSRSLDFWGIFLTTVFLQSLQLQVESLQRLCQRIQLG